MTQLQRSLAAMRTALFGNGPRVSGEEGQTLAEYAMILALIALVVILVVTLLGNEISSIFSAIASGITP